MSSSRLSADERATLWELSEIDIANQNARKKVIDSWVENADYMAQALANDSLGLHAAIGLNATLSAYFDSRANKAVDGLVKALESQQEMNSFRLSSLGNALAALAAPMNPNDAASVAARGASVLAKALENPQEMDSFRLSSLGNALAALVARMNPNDAASVAARGASFLAKALKYAKETDSDRLSNLGDALAALAAQIPSARQTQLLALSNRFLGKISGPPKDGDGRETEAQVRSRIAKICEFC